MLIKRAIVDNDTAHPEKTGGTFWKSGLREFVQIVSSDEAVLFCQLSLRE